MISKISKLQLLIDWRHKSSSKTILADIQIQPSLWMVTGSDSLFRTHKKLINKSNLDHLSVLQEKKLFCDLTLEFYLLIHTFESDWWAKFINYNFKSNWFDWKNATSSFHRNNSDWLTILMCPPSWICKLRLYTSRSKTFSGANSLKHWAIHLIEIEKLNFKITIFNPLKPNFNF